MKVDMKYQSICDAMILAVTIFAFDANADEAMLPQSRAVAVSLMQELGAALKKEIAVGGPESAVNVCTEIAPALARKYSLDSGWRVTRVSLKARNAMLGTPDVWEQQALADFDARTAAGEGADKLEYFAVVDEPSGRYFRYVKALPVQPLCLACHGQPEQLTGAVKGNLAKIYPHDRAIGYSSGQVRGAISIKRPLPQQ
jgi:Protein of unknown function (DUF3365)